MRINPDLIRDIEAETYPNDTTVLRIHPESLRDNAEILARVFNAPSWRLQSRVAEVHFGPTLVVRDSRILLGDYHFTKGETILRRGPLMVV